MDGWLHSLLTASDLRRQLCGEREGGREGGREEGRKEGRKEGREGEMERMHLNMDVLSGTHTSKRTRNYWRVSNTLQFKLPPRLGPVTILVSHMNYYLLNHRVNITNYFIPFLLPTWFFTNKSSPNLRIYHSKCLLQPFAKAVSVSNSLFLLVQLSSGTPYLMK